MCGPTREKTPRLVQNAFFSLAMMFFTFLRHFEFFEKNHFCFRFFNFFSTRAGGRTRGLWVPSGPFIFEKMKFFIIFFEKYEKNVEKSKSVDFFKIKMVQKCEKNVML